jgi:hypothetical protein
MMGQITDQKQSRYRGRPEHAKPVLGDAFLEDVTESGQQENAAKAV